MKTREIYGGNYLNAEDLKGKGDRPATISEVTIKEFDDGSRKAVLHFEKTEKTLALNATNANMLQEITGSDDTDHWVGAKVILYFDPNVMYAGKRTGGLRLKAPNGQPTQTRYEPPPTAQPITDEDIPF